MKPIKQIKKTREASPLFKYWGSEQNKDDEMERLSMSNPSGPYKEGVALFNEEPYKWEILYQSILKEIIMGDKSCINSLSKLLLSVNISEREKVIKNFSKLNLLEKEIIAEISEIIFSKENDILNGSHYPGKKNNVKRFIRILIAIFTNPYGVELKAKKTKLYEHTGYIINAIKQPYT